MWWNWMKHNVMYMCLNGTNNIFVVIPVTLLKRTCTFEINLFYSLTFDYQTIRNHCFYHSVFITHVLVARVWAVVDDLQGYLLLIFSMYFRAVAIVVDSSIILCGWDGYWGCHCAASISWLPVIIGSPILLAMS